MAQSSVATELLILAVDIGATTIKFALTDPNGQLVDAVARMPTPYPCSPTRLVETVAREIAHSGCTKVGVGFPGALLDGLVIEPGNLSRPNGFTSPIDQALHEEWLNTDLQRLFCEVTRQDVRVVNDATLAALGCAEGRGHELVFTLGTGFGIALVIDGSLKPIRDVGAEIFLEGESYDRVLGDYARSLDEERWHAQLVQAVDGFVDEFTATTVHLGGGNSRRVNLAAFASRSYRIVVNDNDATLSGAAKLFAG
jgi:polyphosphate glucokinase